MLSVGWQPLDRVIRLRLGRRSVNLLPVRVTQRTKTLTKGVVGRTCVADREFESHGRHEHARRTKSLTIGGGPINAGRSGGSSG